MQLPSVGFFFQNGGVFSQVLSCEGSLVRMAHVLPWCSILEMHCHATGEGCRCHANVVTGVTKLTVFVWAMEPVDYICAFEHVLVWIDVVAHDETTHFGVVVVDGELKSGVRLLALDVVVDDVVKDALINSV